MFQVSIANTGTDLSDHPLVKAADVVATAVEAVAANTKLKKTAAAVAVADTVIHNLFLLNHKKKTACSVFFLFLPF